MLRGSRKTLIQDHPSLIIEIEERYNSGSLKRVCSILENIGYSGFFLFNQQLTPIGEFNGGDHQNIENLARSRSAVY